MYGRYGIDELYKLLFYNLIILSIINIFVNSRIISIIETILKLTKGEEVKLPIWDFARQERKFKDPMKLKENQPILIEGMHQSFLRFQ